MNLIRIIIPKTELEKIIDHISTLKNDPDNYGKISAMYLKLHTMYAVMIGKRGDVSINFYYSQFFFNLHKDYRERYFEHKLKQNENE
jgi:hypothetical protein